MSRTDRPDSDPLDDGNPILDFRRRFALWNNLSFWRQWALGASLAAVALSGVLVFHTTAAPGYVAVLRSADDGPTWLVSANAADGVLSVRPVGVSTGDGQSYALWAIADDGAPQSLGTIRSSGETAIQLDVEFARRISDATALALMAAGEAPSAATGRPIYRGQWLPLAR